jgi:hypothetical protein
MEKTNPLKVLNKWGFYQVVSTQASLYTVDKIGN